LEEMGGHSSRRDYRPTRPILKKQTTKVRLESRRFFSGGRVKDRYHATHH